MDIFVPNEKTNLSLENLFFKILEEIKKHDSIICLRHIRPDGDAFGSQLGLRKIINLNFPNKKVYCSGNEVDFFKQLGLMDKISDDTFRKSLVIVTDSASTTRIDDSRFSLANKIIRIDHHPNDTPYGDLSWVDSSFTSASEMIGYFALKNNLKINKDIAKTILFGFITDSNQLTIDKASSRAYSVASYLLETGVTINEVLKVVNNKKVNFLKAQSEVIINSIIKRNVAACFLTKELIKKYDIPYDRNDMFVNLFEYVEGINVRVYFAANEDGTTRVEFRSDGPIIKGVAEKYGGGGHPLIAGATISDIKLSKDIIMDLYNLPNK